MKYLSKLLKLAGELSAAGPALHYLMIEHDAWCAALNGKGACNCDPAVRVSSEDEVFGPPGADQHAV